jgi:hypothetical protein
MLLNRNRCTTSKNPQISTCTTSSCSSSSTPPAVLRLGGAAPAYDDEECKGLLPISVKPFDETISENHTINSKRTTHIAGLLSKAIMSSCSLSKDLLHQFLSSQVMHAIGLRMIWQLDKSFLLMAKSILGAGLEGVLLIHVLAKLLHFKRQEQNTSTTTRMSYVICFKVRLVLAFALGITSITFLMGNVLFMDKIGQTSLPDMFVISSAVKELDTVVHSELSLDSKYVAQSVIICAVTSLPIVYQVWKKVQRTIRECRDKSTSPTVVDIRIPGQHGGQQHVPQEVMKHQTRKRRPWQSLAVRKRFVSLLSLSSLYIITILVYLTGAWMPIFHTYASICGSFVFSPPGESIDYIEYMQSVAKQGNDIVFHGDDAPPNIVFIIHESLSGEYILSTENIPDLMPFFQKWRSSSSTESDTYSDEEYFIFDNVRSISGDTVDCVTSITTGCNPLNHGPHGGRDIALLTNMATEAKQRGYETVSFSSRKLNMKGTRWFMIQDKLSVNFDKVYSPTPEDKLVNEAAMSDLSMVNNFEKWLNERKDKEEESKKPFFAQFYLFDAHYPFYKEPIIERHPSSTSETERVDGMIQSVDKSVENVFKFLKDSGMLENTVVFGSGDHGEEYVNKYEGKWRFRRLHEWSSDILHPFTYMYIPKKVSEKIRNDVIENLKHNQKQLVSTLDFFPTILDIMGRGKSARTWQMSSTENECNVGYNLITEKIQPDRIAYSYAGMVSDFSSGWGKKSNFAIHYKTSSSLYHTGSKLIQLEYNDIINFVRDDTMNPETQKTNEMEMEEWKSLVEQLKSDSRSKNYFILAQKGAKKLLRSLKWQSMWRSM